MKSKVKGGLKYIRSVTDFKPKAALILGSGLGGYSQKLTDVVCTIPYSSIPGFPLSTVSGHSGKFIMGYVNDVPVVCMDGRVHYYEGYSVDDVVLPIRVMGALGAEFLVLTNAAGGINTDFRPGTLVLLKDHISLFVPNPLKGVNDPAEGPRFPDMSNVYDPRLRHMLIAAAAQEGIPLETGVYCQLTGPSYETPAEIRLLRTLGADIVGMSTVMEAIVARHMGMKVCGISLVTNMAAGISLAPLSHEDVKNTGSQSAPVFSRLVTAAINAVKDY